MHFLTDDALVLILSHPLRVILRSYKWKDWVNVIFSYSCDNLSSVWRNCEFDISFTVNLSYWEKPYCNFPWPFYISLFAVNWVNLRFASDFGNTCHYNLTNYMFVVGVFPQGLFVGLKSPLTIILRIVINVSGLFQYWQLFLISFLTIEFCLVVRDDVIQNGRR